MQHFIPWDYSELAYQVLLLCISIIVGGIIGLEREYRNKSAGLRTFILVAFGSCLFTILSLTIGIGNPDRLAANIVTGIGFLGAGIIFKDSNRIGGITTATSVWATASLGMAVGSGYFILAILGALLMLLVLQLLVGLERKIDHQHKIHEYTITFTSQSDFEYCEQLFKQYHLKSKLTKQLKMSTGYIGTWHVTGKLKAHNKLIMEMMEDVRILTYSY